MYMPVCLTLSMFVCLCVCLFVAGCLCLYGVHSHLSMHVQIVHDNNFILYLYTSLSIHEHDIISFFVCLVCLSLCLYVYLSVCPSVYPCLCLCVCLAVRLS